MEFTKEDRPFGEKVEERKERAEKKGREFKEDIKERGTEVKEDLKGASRRVEGEITGDEGLKREHEPSMLEKAGEAISNAAVYVKDTAYEGAQKIGLVKEDEHK